MKFLLPTGIGDSVWALHKVQAIRDAHAPGDPIDIYLVGSEEGIDNRALDFVKRFTFVRSVSMRPYSIHREESRYKQDGTYNYIDDGFYEFGDERFCVLIPNAALERGERLESWLPHHAIRWDIWNDFTISSDERDYADQLSKRIGDYVVFYPGPLNGNTEFGHNRSALWRPEDWRDLGRSVYTEYGLKIVVVGAPYDASYWQWILSPLLQSSYEYWYNIIGQTNLGRLWSVTSRAKFVVSYQAGVGIISTYLGTPTAIWWRPYGDSIDPNDFLSFNEGMASAWVPPVVLDRGTHLPIYYGRHGVSHIMAETRRRGWAVPQPTGSSVGA